jgi:hypothetical protein
MLMSQAGDDTPDDEPSSASSARGRTGNRHQDPLREAQRPAAAPVVKAVNDMFAEKYGDLADIATAPLADTLNPPVRLADTHRTGLVRERALRGWSSVVERHPCVAGGTFSPTARRPAILEAHVSQSIRSLPAARPARRSADTAHRDRSLRRVLAEWRSLAGSYLAAQAHGEPDQFDLFEALRGIENVGRLRHRSTWRQFQPVLDRLLRQAPHECDWAIASSECATCRRMVRDLPSVANLLTGIAPG